MKKKILLSLFIAVLVYVFIGHKSVDIDQNQKIAKTQNTVLDNLSAKHQKKAAQIASEMTKNHKHQEDQSVDNHELKIEDFIINIEDNSYTQGLISTIGLLTEINLTEVDVNSIALRLKDIGLTPKITKSENPETGSMKVLRSSTAIPGLRYFHAQIFNDNGKDFVQHVSFEYRPGEKSFKEVVSGLVKNYSLTQRPDVLAENFVLWKLDDGHILWAKKLGKEELLNDPIYPHDEKDIGTIKVAIEQEIH